MAQTFTNNAGSGPQGVQTDYPLTFNRGLPGQLAGLENTTVVSGSNETGARIAYGIPLALNTSGVLPNSAKPAVAAGALLGLHVRTNNHEIGPSVSGYPEGVPDGQAVNILKVGTIYLEVIEAVAPGDALRYYKSGPNAGKWGKTASAGNSLALAAGGWEILKAGSATQVLKLMINTPEALSVTADI